MDDSEPETDTGLNSEPDLDHETSESEIDTELDSEPDLNSESSEPAIAPKAKAKPRAKKSKPKSLTPEDTNLNTFASSRKPYKFSFDNPLDFGKEPLSTVSQFFEHLAYSIYKQYSAHLDEFCKKLKGKPITVITFCSGTEAPIIALLKILNGKFVLMSF